MGDLVVCIKYAEIPTIEDVAVLRTITEEDAVNYF